MTQATIQRLAGRRANARFAADLLRFHTARPETTTSERLWQGAMDFITLRSRAGQVAHRALLRLALFGIGHIIGHVILAGKRGLWKIGI